MKLKKTGLIISFVCLAFVLVGCGHKHSYNQEVVEPTCEEQGYTEYTCECGDVYKDSYVDAKGHSYGEWTVIKEATEAEEGLKERACACGKKEQETLPKLDHVHKYTEEVVEPTCKEQGYTEHTCECGYSYKDSYVDVLEHSYGDWEIVKEATETEEGLKERECSCGEKETEVIPSLPDTTAPVLTLEGVEENVKLNAYKEFNPLTGIKAIDNKDGDISGSIEVEGSVDNTTRGTYELKYTVKDEAGNEDTLTRTVTVVWDYVTSFIGHGGCYYGVMNSEEAILYAASVLKYQAIEIDVKVTKDGVFVLSHDDTFGGVTIATTNYADLKDIEVTSSKTASLPMAEIGQTSMTYKSKICTLDRYLEICKEYGVRPVIELKGGTGISQNSQSNMGKLMKMIEDHGLLEECILLGSAYNCLIWTRENGYENVECQYLVDSCASETYLERCIKYNLDISICVTYGNGQLENTPEWIARYQDAGLRVSTYTFTQYTTNADVQKWVDLGVDYVTVDWHNMAKIKHVENSSINTHTVTYLDKDGNVLKEAKVKDGRAASAPKAPVFEGYKFIGWDKPISNVTEDFTVTAQYELDTYAIKYNENLSTFTESTFANKQEFVDEFYQDLFDWFVSRAGTNEYIQNNYNGTYSVIRNATANGKATFSSAADIKDLDIYVFESALSSFMYKPISGTNSADYVTEEDDNYFLNSEPYRTKYINLNAYFFNCMKTSYTGYSKEYNQASNNRVQIFFRFHQWAKGTNIPAFNTIPTYFKIETKDVEFTLPTVVSYTVEDEIVLEPAVAEGMTFLGWYTDKECTNAISKIEKGSTGNITLYAKWAE